MRKIFLFLSAAALAISVGTASAQVGNVSETRGGAKLTPEEQRRVSDGTPSSTVRQLRGAAEDNYGRTIESCKSRVDGSLQCMNDAWAARDRAIDEALQKQLKRSDGSPDTVLVSRFEKARDDYQKSLQQCDTLSSDARWTCRSDAYTAYSRTIDSYYDILDQNFQRDRARSDGSPKNQATR